MQVFALGIVLSVELLNSAESAIESAGIRFEVIRELTTDAGLQRQRYVLVSLH